MHSKQSLAEKLLYLLYKFVEIRIFLYLCLDCEESQVAHILTENI